MDVQFYGGNCVVLSNKDVRLVLDDSLAELGLKSVAKPGDVALFTGAHGTPSGQPKLIIDQPGEYEVSGLSIVGIAAQAHIDEGGTRKATIYKVLAGDMSYLFCGHIDPSLSDAQLEAIGMVDVMFVPVGGNGYTLDPTGALQLIKKVEPKLVVPTHYADKDVHYPVEQRSLDEVIKNLAMEPRDIVTKLHLKPADLTSDIAQLTILERVS